MTRLFRRPLSSTLPLLLLAGLFLSACGSSGGSGTAHRLRQPDPAPAPTPTPTTGHSSFNKATSKRQIPMLTINSDTLLRFPVTPGCGRPAGGE